MNTFFPVKLPGITYIDITETYILQAFNLRFRRVRNNGVSTFIKLRNFFICFYIDID